MDMYMEMAENFDLEIDPDGCLLVRFELPENVAERIHYMQLQDEVIELMDKIKRKYG